MPVMGKSAAKVLIIIDTTKLLGEFLFLHQLVEVMK